VSPSPLVRLADPTGVADALAELGVRPGRPVLTVVGGAGGLGDERLEAIAGLLLTIVPALDQWGAAVVYGGTDSGVMRLLGDAREAAGAAFPLIAVAAAGTVVAQAGESSTSEPDPGSAAGSEPGKDAASRAELDPGRSHVLLVPGSEWGDEAPWLAEVATAVAAGQPSATLVLNGGDITYADMERSLAAARPVIVVAGTGRAADAVAGTSGDADPEDRAGVIAASPLTRVVDLGDPVDVLRVLRQSLTGAGA
jgi:hypothetical protein